MARVMKKKRQQSKQIPTFLYMLLPPCVLSFITAFVYYPSLNYPFQFDDIANISKKFAIRFDNPLGRWWFNSRWLGDWLNRMNYKLGHFDPFYYRLVNLIIHITCGVVVFFLVYNLCKFLTKKPFFLENALYLATIISGLFLLHPTQTQTVSYVIQARLEGLAALFVLSTVFFYTQFFASTRIAVKIISLALMFATGFFSCGTKEIMVVIPFMLLLVDWFFISQQEWQQFKNRLGIHFLFVVAIIGAMVWYLGFDFFKRVITLNTATGNNRGNIITPHAFDSITPFTYLMSEFKVIVHYLWIYIFPFNLSVEYDWKITQGFFTLDTFVPFLILLSLGVSVAWNMIKKSYIYLTFGLMWFFTAVAPRSTLIPSPELVCDYKTYLASFGMMFLMGVLLLKGLKAALWFLQNISSQELRLKLHEQTTLMVFFILFMTPIGIGTVMRNQVWSSAVVFWEDNARKAPGKARVHNNYGVALSEAGRIDEAILAYQKAINMDRHYQDPCSNIAVAYSMKGDYDKAIESLQRAIVVYPDYPEAYNNIGSLLIQQKKYDQAEKMLNKAKELRPWYGKAYYNLARLYEAKGESQKVWEHLQKATQGDLDVPEVFYKLGQMSLKVEKWDEAIKAFQKAYAMGMKSPNVLFNLANAYFMNKDYVHCKPLFEQLVRLNPLDARYAYNLGETYYTQRNYDKALAVFRKTTQLPKPLPQAFFRVANCLERMDKTDQASVYLHDLLKLQASDDFKRFVKNEITRIDLSTKLKAGNGSIRLNDLNAAMDARRTMTT